MISKICRGRKTGKQRDSPRNVTYRESIDEIPSECIFAL